MARIEKRGENSWRITVELGRDKATGERRIFRKTVRCGKGKVKTEAKLFEAEIRKGTYFKPNSITLAVHLRDWLKRKKPYIKRLTYRDYNMFIEKHFIQYFGENLLLKDLETYHIERYKNYKLTEGRLNGSGGLAARTVQYHLVVFTEALEDAVTLELIPKNPAKKIKAPKVSKKKQREKITILSPDQMKIFLKEGSKNKYFDCWYFSIFTGVRRGEMLGLRFQDTNWEQNSATLFQEVLVNPDKGGGVIFDEDLKTEESAKAIPLTAGLIKILKRRKKVVAQNKLLFGAEYKDHDLVFCKEDGSPINPKTLYNNFKKFTRSIGIEMRYHDLRHNLASLLLAEGYSIKMIQEILRHTTSVITTDLYLHLFPQADNEAVQNLENKLINSG